MVRDPALEDRVPRNSDGTEGAPRAVLQWLKPSPAGAKAKLLPPVVCPAPACHGEQNDSRGAHCSRCTRAIKSVFFAVTATAEQLTHAANQRLETAADQEQLNSLLVYARYLLTFNANPPSHK